MSAPLIWIGFPLLAALLLWFLRYRSRWMTTLAVVIPAILALLAWQLVLDAVTNLGPLNLTISSTLTVVGRKFVILNTDRPFLTLVYGVIALWFFLAGWVGVQRWFFPLGLAITALLVAATAVQPFLYAALLVEMAVLLSLPMLSPPGRPVGRGVLRYIVFQTLALPSILLAGYFAGGVESGGGTQFVLQAAILLALGFGLWLAIFPFYTWMPLLASEAHPFTAGFILSVLPVVVLFLSLDYLSGITWISGQAALPGGLRLVGAVMVFSGGLLAAFQKDLARLLAYAVIIENGFALIALSLSPELGYPLLAMSMLPRLMGLALFALALAVMVRAGIPLTLEGVRGLMRRQPFTSAALVVAYFGLGGLPLLPAFPVRQLLMENLAIGSLPEALWVLAGVVGFLLTGIRLFVSLVESEATGWVVEERRIEAVLLTGGAVSLLLMGLFPQWLLSGLPALVQGFIR